MTRRTQPEIQSSKSQDRHVCEESVWTRGHWHSKECGKTAKVERDGKWYCGIHDPVRVAEKRAARDAEFDRKWAEQTKAHQLRAAAPELYEALEALWIWSTEQRTHLDTDPVPDGLGATVIAVLLKAEGR